MTHQATTDLASRMKLHTEGQITWPEPALGLHCDTCRHYLWEKSGRGRCDLVKAHQRVDGKQFHGAVAVACPQHEHGQHPRNALEDTASKDYGRDKMR